MARPSLVCVGPMKTSTSWLYYQLKSYPAVWLSPIKELQLLDFLDVSVHSPSPAQVKAYKRKLTSLSRQVQSVLKADEVTADNLATLKVWAQAAFTERFDFEWYGSFFNTAPDGQTVIEIAPTYAYAADENVRLFADFLGSETRILFILRNPIDRWLSQGRFDLKLALNQPLDDQTIPLAAEFLSQKWTQVGGYPDYIEKWERYFSNVHFVFFEDLHAPGGKGLAQICKLANLQYDTSNFSDLEKRVNSHSVATFPVALQTWVADQRMNEVNWLAERFGGHAISWLEEAKKLIGG